MTMKRFYLFILSVFAITFALSSCNDSDPMSVVPTDQVPTKSSTPYVKSISRSPGGCFAPGSQIHFYAIPSVSGNYTYNWSVRGPSNSTMYTSGSFCSIDFGPSEGFYTVSCSLTDPISGITSQAHSISMGVSESCPRY